VEASIVAQTTVNLTDREIDVLRLLAAGRSPKQVARLLYLSERTVRHQMETARRRLDSPTMLAAMVRAQSLGLLDPDRSA
jgi:DNA-binding CsgD family transcriptional regulator